MEPIRVFVSHSSKDKEIAARMAEAMRQMHMKPFLAHSHIEGGELWRETLRDEVEGCDMLVALVTPNFRKSEYTEQEVGAAWVLKKPVLAVCTGDEVPTGFVAERQGLKYDVRRPGSAAERMLDLYLSEVRKKANVADVLIEMISESGSFETSNRLANLLLRERTLTAKQVENATRALKTNKQVPKSSGVIKSLLGVLGSLSTDL